MTELRRDRGKRAGAMWRRRDGRHWRRRGLLRRRRHDLCETRVLAAKFGGGTKSSRPFAAALVQVICSQPDIRGAAGAGRRSALTTEPQRVENQLNQQLLSH
jgi:hypothetical protein